MRRFDLGSILFRSAGYKAHRVRARTGDVRIFEANGFGSLPPIVVIHGLSADAVGYMPLLYRLRLHSRRVIAAELPGHGGSDAPEGLTLGACVEGVCEALDAHVREPAIVFGNSLGGLSAIRFALGHPDRVRGLFLASPAGAPSSPEELDALLAKFHIETKDDALRFLEIIFHDKPGPLRHVFARDLVRRHRMPALRALIRDVPNAHPLEPKHLAHLAKMPKYLFWGRSERLLPPSHLAFFKEHLQNATIEEPYGFGHSPQLESPIDVARRVIAFARDN